MPALERTKNQLNGLNVNGDINFSGNLFNNNGSIIYANDGSIKTVGLSGSGAKNIISPTADIGALLTSLITADNTIIQIYQGSYTLTTSIVIRYSGVKISGAHRENTTILSTITNDYAIDIENTVSTSNITIEDLTIDNTVYTNVGAVGIFMKELRNTNIENVNVNNFEIGIILDGRNFFNDIENVRFLKCLNTVKLTGPDSTHKPNQNTFVGCLFNGTIDKIVQVEMGNNNCFFHNSFEDWGDIALDIQDGNANTFESCRFECGTTNPTNGYVNFGVSSGQNVLNNAYFTDNGESWNGWDNSIVDLGGGNCINSLNTYKDQRVKWKKNQATAGDFVDFIRTGSGDNKSILTLTDEYANSGNPIQLSISSARGTGKYISGNYGITENFYVANSGDIFTTGKICLGTTQTYIANEASTNMKFFTNDLERMRIESGGNIGIGITDPAHALDVIGEIKTDRLSITDAIEFTDLTVAPGVITNKLYLLNGVLTFSGIAV